MDENKKKSLENSPSAENEPSAPDYKEEMEELARIFKEELDRAVQDAEDAAQVDSIEELEVEGYDPKALSSENAHEVIEEELCECCGERPRGTRKNPNSAFCEQCEAILEKYPYDWKGIVAVIAMLGIVIASVVMLAYQVPLFSKMKLGDKALAKGQLYTAMTKYDEAVECVEKTKLPDYYGLHAKRVIAEYKLLDMGTALSDCDEYLPEGIRRLPSFKDVNDIYDEILEMQGSAYIISNALAEYADVVYDEVIPLLDGFSGTKIYYKDNEFYSEKDESFTPDGTEQSFICNEGWINIYKYSAAQYAEKDDAVLIGFLEKAAESSEYLKRLVYPLLASTCAGSGDYDKALSLADEVHGFNAESADYYMINAMVCRYRDGDYEKAIKFCDDGLLMLLSLTNGEEMSHDLGYILAIQRALSLIMQAENATGNEKTNKLKEALDFAGDAYSYSGTIQARDLYAIVAYAVDNTEVIDALNEEIKNYGDDIAFGEDVTAYRDGKKSLTDIAMSGRYDLQ